LHHHGSNRTAHQSSALTKPPAAVTSHVVVQPPPPVAVPPARASAPPPAPSAAAIVVPDLQPAAATIQFTSALSDIPLAQVQSLLVNLQTTLDLIESGLESKAFASSLPLVGNQLGTVFSQGQAALAAFKTLDAKLIAALQTIENAGTPTTAALVQTALNSAITAAGWSGNASTTLDGAGNLTVTLHDSESPTGFSVPLDANFGIPGINFQSQGSAHAALTWGFDLSAAVTQGGSFSVSAPSGAVTLGLALTAPNFAGDANFGPLRMTAADNGSTLSGTITLDTAGSATLSGNANVDVNLATDLGTAALPSISTELKVAWPFGASTTLDPASHTALGQTPTVTLQNVSLGMGSFVTNMVKPVLDDLAKVTEPLQPIVNLLTSAIAPIMALPSVVWHQLDYNNDGTVSLLDFFVKDHGGSDSSLNKVVSLVGEINSLDAAFQNVSLGGAQYALGSFTLPAGSYDIRQNGFDISQVVPQISGAQSITQFVNSVAGDATLRGNLTQLLTPTTSDQGGFNFPILDNPASAAAVLFGGTADLVTYQLPETQFGSGTIDNFGNVTNATTLAAIPIFTGVNLILTAALAGRFGLKFGYDTTGLSDFVKSGYADPGLLLDGLYVANPTLNGLEVPAVTFGGSVGLGIAAGITGTDISGTGDVSGVVNLGFANNGTEHLGNLLGLLNTNPLGLFNVDGRITAGLDFNIDVGGQNVFGVSSPRVVLYPPQGQGAAANGVPTLTEWRPDGPSTDFETAGNWSEPFATHEYGLSAGTWDVYADATIDPDTIGFSRPVGQLFWEADFNGPLEADLYSLKLAADAQLFVQAGTLLIDGSGVASDIKGVLHVASQPGALLGGVLVMSGVVNNSGTIVIDPTAPGTAAPGLTAAGVLDLTGGGFVHLDNDAALVMATTAPTVHTDTLLRNDDNTIFGHGVIYLPFENHGAVDATDTRALVIDHDFVNKGVVEATTKPGALFGTGGTLEVQADLQGGGNPMTVTNTGGTIAAAAFGTVFLGAANISGPSLALTIRGGTLKVEQSAGTAEGTMTVRNYVSLDGGLLGMTVDALIGMTSYSGGDSALQMSGLFNLPSFASAPGKKGFVTGGETIYLSHADLRGGLLDARQVAGHGAVVIQNSVTLDGSAGAVGVGLAGTLAIGAGNTLALAGAVAPSLGGAEIRIGGGTLVVGATGNDAATLAAAVGGDSGAGTLLLDGISSTVTASDTSAILTNTWLISGTGLVATGFANQSTIEAAGVFLGLDAGTVASSNQGLIVARPTSLLIMDATLDNSGGTILANGGTILLRGHAVGGGTLNTDSGGVIETLNGQALGGATPLTLAAGANIQFSASQALAGPVVNLTTLTLTGNSTTPLTATLAIQGSATLSGGGSLLLVDAGGAGAGSTQVIAGGAAADTLDNIDNLISGTGQIGLGPLTVINEAAGTIRASAGTLALAATLINHGTFTATPGATLDLTGTLIDAGDSLLVDGATLLLDGGTIAGGTIAVANTDTLLALGGTLDGSADPLTLPAAATLTLPGDLPAPAIAALTLRGTIANKGTIALDADSARPGMQHTLQIYGTVSLNGGGSVTFADSAATGAAAGDLVASPQGLLGTLVNVDNRMTGHGQFGLGGLIVHNQPAGLIAAEGGTLIYQPSPGTGGSVNQGTLAAIGGTLDMPGTVANAGGTIGAWNDGLGHPGLVVLDGLTVQGGTLASDTADLASHLVDTALGLTLDGTASAVTLAPAGQVTIRPGSTLTLHGTLTDQGTIAASGTTSLPVRVAIGGTALLRGTGTLSLADATATGTRATQIIAGASAADTLDNGAVISGLGLLGNRTTTLINSTGGTVSATGGTLFVDTATIAIANTGLLAAAPSGTLDLRGNIANTGGTVAATGSGVAILNGITLTGGHIGGTGGIVLGNTTTIDALTAPVTIDPAASLGLIYNDLPGSMALFGTIANHGTMFVQDDQPSVYAGQSLEVRGALILSGGGQVLLQDDKASQYGTSAYLIGAPAASPYVYGQNTLDNIDNAIGGAGRLGNPALAITNEAAGVIFATGTLAVITASGNSIPSNGFVVNKGTMAAEGGDLYLNALIDNHGGTIEALAGGGHAGTVDLNTVTISGGTLLTDATSSILSTNATLDGTSGAVTLGAGNVVAVHTSGSLRLTGDIVNLGTVALRPDAAGYFANVLISGTAALSGGGTFQLTSPGNGLGAEIYAADSGATDTLDNIDNLLIGSGEIGFSRTSLTNEAQGRIIAQGGRLLFDPTGPGTTVVNRGLLGATGGTLDVRGTIDNASGTFAARSDGLGHSGTIVLTGATIAGGVLASDTSDPASLFFNTGGPTTTLDGTTTPVTLDPSARFDIVPGTVIMQGSIVDQGLIALIADSSQFYGQATLKLSGHVVFSGGGSITLTDQLGNPGGRYTQIITGTTAADTLDNEGVTITGVGEVGNGFMSLVNGAAGSILAQNGTLVIAALGTTTNHGLLGALPGGTLDLMSRIDNAGGTFGAAGGLVVLDGNGAIPGTITGGTLAGVVDSYFGTVNSATIAPGATLEIDAQVPNTYAKMLTLSGTIANHGLLLVQGSDKLVGISSQLEISGTVALSGGGTLALQGLNPGDTGTQTQVLGLAPGAALDNVDNLIAGTGTIGLAGLTITDEAAGLIRAQAGLLDIAGPINGTGTLEIADSATLALDSTIDPNLTLAFRLDGTHETLRIGAPSTPALTVADFIAGDTIVLAGNHGTVTRSLAGNTVTLLGNGTPFAAFTFADNQAAQHITSVANSGSVTLTTSVACFAAGTRILTATGPVPVEALSLGDRVISAFGGTVPITWTGHRHLDCRRHPRPWDVAPIRIAADAFGPGTPHAPLRLSPDHAIFVDGHLIPARYLVNGATIIQEHDTDHVTYWHVELPTHDVLLAENLPCESYLDTGNRSAFANTAPTTQLHPGFARTIWDQQGCAPLTTDGDTVTILRHTLLARAATLGFHLTQDPALRLLANGRPLPLHPHANHLSATLPPGTTTLRLISRHWTPAHTNPTSPDHRQLGIGIANLTLDHHPIPLDDPRLTTGWHPPEPTWRWTTGIATITATNATKITLTLPLPGHYWLPPAPEARRAGLG